MLSTLLRLSKYEGDLPESESMLKDVQNYIRMDKKNAERLNELSLKYQLDTDMLIKELSTEKAEDTQDCDPEEGRE